LWLEFGENRSMGETGRRLKNNMPCTRGAQMWPRNVVYQPLKILQKEQDRRSGVTA